MNGETPNLIPDDDQPEEPRVEEVGGTPDLEPRPPGDLLDSKPVGDAPEPDFYSKPPSTQPRKAKVKNGDDHPRRRRWPLYLVIGCMVMPCLCCAALLCASVAAGATVAAVFDNSKVTASGTETVQIAPDSGLLTLDVTDRLGSVTIQKGSSDAVQIDYTKTAYGLTKGAAQKELDKITVNVTQPTATDNRVVIDANPDRTKDTFFALANNVDLTISVPEDVAIIVHSNVGAIKILDVRAQTLDVNTNAGTITFDGALTGDSGATYSLQTDVGEINVTLPLDTYAAIDAQTDVGSIDVATDFTVTNPGGNSSGPGQTWTGTIGAQGTTSAPPLRLRVSTGDITISAQP